MRLLAIAALSLPATLVACAADGPTVATEQQAIIGGSAAPDDGAVVLLASYPPNRSVLATCTAVLIAPTVVVTAAHCVDATNHPGYLYGVFPGADASIYPRLVDLEPHLLPVTTVHAHPSYNPAAPFHADLGVAILAAPLAGVAPIKLWRDPVDTLVGGPARIVGYGQQVVGTPASTRRQAATIVAGVDADDTVRVGDVSHLTCLGDSGGPALVDRGGVEVLLGIDSYADNASCDRPAHFRRADLYQAFLDSYTGDHPPEVDAGVTGPDAGDAPSKDDGGCTTSGGAAPWPLALAVGLLGLGLRRRRVRPS